MKCAKCGNALQAGERFCGECGTPVTVVTPPPIAVPPAIAPDWVRQGVTPPPVMPPPPPPAASSRRGLFLGIGGVAIASGLTYLVTRSPWKVVAGKSGGGDGAIGSGAGEFNVPGGIAVDGNGAVWVSDSDNHRIQVRDPDGRWRVAGGKAGGGDGAIGSGAGEFWGPSGIAVDGNGAVWVADSWNHRIQRYGVR